MAYLNILRRLVDNQQFSELKNSAKGYWTESSDVQALPLLALAHAHLGERKEVESCLLDINTRQAELDADAQVDLAAVLILVQRIPAAMALLDAVLIEAPDHALALARRAWCYMQQEELDMAREMYERSATLVPGRIPIYTSLVHLFLEQENYQAAQVSLDAAIVRLQELYNELPESVVTLNTMQLRELQLAIWLADGQFACIEAWLEEKREELSEDEWVGLVIAYTNLLGRKDLHDQAAELYRDSVKHYPENIDLLHPMADLAQLQGLSMQAINLVHRAIRLSTKQKKPSAVLWAKLSSLCLHQDEKKARHAAGKSVELSEAMEESDTCLAAEIHMIQAQAKCAMAQVESQEQNFDKAETMFRELLQDNPYFLPALQGLGQMQMQRGDIDEAVELFERVKEIAPAKGHSALINARQFPEDESTLHKIEKAARRPSMEGAVSSGLLFQLASAWEKRKDYDKAFALAEEANLSTGRFLKYDAKAHRNSCARTRTAFCAELYEHRKDCGVDSSLPVYVLGMPRSGTTLVEQILAGHSDIFGAGELGVIPQVIQGLRRWERHTGSGRKYPECIDDLNPYVSKGIANNVLKELQEFQAEAKHVIDKLPHNFENVGLIKFLFPNAKIISVRRDPRDIAMSNYFTDYQAKFGGMGFAYDLTDIGQQLADHNMMMHHWKQVFPGQILEINYEDVVEDTEGSARKMLDYIGVDWQPEVLAFNELDRPVKTASVWQVRQPIYKTSKAKWMRYQSHLAPLIKGTNANIEIDPINDMARLPEPGWLVEGVALYKQEKLDEAEYLFKKLLHHVPEHAAANFMLGLVYVHKGHLEEGVKCMEKGLDKCPWNKNWRKDLIQAYEMTGATDKAEALKQKKGKVHADIENDWDAVGGDGMLGDGVVRNDDMPEV